MTELLQRFGVSLLLGAFIGLERERGRHALGIRTFCLVSGLGTLAAMLASSAKAPWILALIFLALAGLVIASRYGPQVREEGPGITTEVAAFMTFGLGAIVYYGPVEVAVAVGVVTAAILHFKPQLHLLAERVGSEHLLAVLQFALVTFVVLPVLPNRAMGPLKVLNPYNIWLMVVLVSGIGLAGYVALKLIGARRGALAAGLLGGTVSSTAVTFSFARQAKQDPEFSPAAAIAVMAATLVTVPRMAVLIAIVHPALFRSAALPLVCLFVACLAPLAGSARRIEAEPSGHTPELRNPMGLGAAILFGALYAAVTLAVAAARTHFGEAGVYTVGALSGLTELDAITLSTARLTATGDLAAQAGTDVVLIAFLANLVFKGAIATALGPRPFCRNVVIAFGIAFAVGVAAIFVF